MKRIALIAAIFLLVGLASGCKPQDVAKVLNVDFTLSEEYTVGESLSGILTFSNTGNTDISLEKIEVCVRNISDKADTVTYRFHVQPQTIKGGSGATSAVTLFSGIPVSIGKGVYGIYLSFRSGGISFPEQYQTFFRVRKDNELTVFRIKSDVSDGVPVFMLDGGMSAEYVVEKAAENLTTGISHSWNVNGPGSGPNHVEGTPDFLENSLNQTVEFYNRTLGANTPIKTVLITTGFPSIPYIANSLKAAVLPLHFLVSVNTVKEVQTILKSAKGKGISTYATLSHDPSVPYAVSWIKLLDLPETYRKFIEQHRVENVIILGATGTNGGETKAKQLLNFKSSEEEYADNSIYIMYPGTSPDDVKTLAEKIVDLGEFKQEYDYKQIADWESGINARQLTNFSQSAKSIGTVKEVMSVTAEDLGKLYNMGAWATLAYMSKNKQHYSGVKGVVFNPYLISHPVAEASMGYVPLLYWQLVGATYTVDNFEKNILRAIIHYFPETRKGDLKLWLNSTRNFGAAWSAKNLKEELSKSGYRHFVENNYGVDEVWNPADGMNAPCELLFSKFGKGSGFKKLKQWNDTLTPLSPVELREVSGLIGGVDVTKF